MALDDPDPADAIRALAPSGVDRVIEVALSDNADLDAAVVRAGAVIAAHASRQDRPDLPFWPLLFANVTPRMLGSDDFPAVAKQHATVDLTAAARDGQLAVPLADPLPLTRAAQAHEQVDRDNRRRTLLALLE